MKDDSSIDFDRAEAAIGRAAELGFAGCIPAAVKETLALINREAGWGD